MNMSQIFFPAFACQYPFPSSNQTSFHCTHLSFHFHGLRPIPSSIVVAERRRNKPNSTGQVSECADVQIEKQSNPLIWKETIRDYVKNGLWEKALSMYYQMQRSGIKPDKWVFLSVIKACSNLSDLQAGKKVHEDIIAGGFESDVFVGTALASMYAKCGRLENARQVFERMPEQNVVSWNAMITGYSHNGQPHEALALFNEMQVQSIKPNSSTLVNVLPVCADLFALEQGMQIHGYIIRNGFESDVVVGTAIIDMYAKCGYVSIAHKLLERMPKQDVVSWTAIITGYSQNDHSHEALALFNKMQVQGIEPNSVTIINVLPACANLLALEQGRQIHGLQSEVDLNLILL